VFERVPAADQVSLQVRILGSVEVLDELHIGGRASLHAFRNEGGIDPDAPVVPEFTQQRKELSLAAPDLEHRLVADVVAVDDPLGERTCKGIERTGEPLRLFVAG
jgi:hypothetical protein